MSAFFLMLSIASLILMIYGIKNPSKVTAKGRSTPTTRDIVIGFCGLAFLFFVLSMVFSGGAEKASQQAPATLEVAEKKIEPNVSAADVTAVKKAHSEIKAIEDDFFNQQERFKKEAPKILSNRNISTNEKAAFMSNAFAKMLVTLYKSKDVKTPTYSNSNLRSSMTEAIELHKKWSVAQQIKIASIVDADEINAKNAGAEADKLALQEGIALYRAFGIANINDF